MKLKLANVSVGKVEAQGSKANTGGAFAKMHITVSANKTIRRALGIGDAEADESWPPNGEKSGKLRGTLDATTLIITAKQGNLVQKLDEVDLNISLVNDFSWQLEDPKDEESKNALISFWARTSDLESAMKMVEYKFSIGSGSSTGSLTYNKPGTGTPVDMSTVEGDDAQGTLGEGEEGEGQGDEEESGTGALASAREAAGGTHQRKRKNAE